MRRALGIGLWVAMVVAGLAVFLFLPHFVSDFHSRDLAQAGAFFIAIIGLNLVTGYTGQISLGHGALMAIGGYTTALLVVHEHWRDVWTIPLAGVVAGVVGFVVGLPALRLSGLYLALATFALAVAMPDLIKKFSHFTGGTNGENFLASAPKQVTGLGGITIFGHTMTQNHFLYYLTWSIGIVGFAVAWLLVRGRGGRTFRSVRDSEVAAASSGVNLAVTKTVAFALSGVYAGVGGALYVIQAEIVDPLSFTVSVSIVILVGAVVGGLGSLWGLVLGALFVEYLPTISNSHVSTRPGVPDFVYGAAIIVVMILLPTGAGGLIHRLVRPLTSWLYTRP